MKAYVSTCGLGLGHASRCLVLAELAKKRGWRVTFSTYSGEAASLIRSRGFEAYEAPSMSYLLNGNGDVDFKLTLAKGPLEIRKLGVHLALEAKHLERAKPNVVISDSRLSTVLVAWALGIPSILIINQLKLIIPRRRPIKGAPLTVKRAVERVGCELLSQAWGKASRILIPDFPPPLTISRENLEIPERLKDKVRLIGPLLDKDLQKPASKTEAKQRLGFQKPLILVSTGGLREERLKLLKAVVSTLSYAEGLKVVVSASLPGGNGLIFKRGGLEVYKWLPNHRELLKAADVLITHGGHTSIAEALSTATPMVIAPLSGHTERASNAKSMERLGVARIVDLDREGPGGLKQAVQEVLEDPSYRERAIEVSLRACRFNGVDEVLDEAQRLAYRAQ